LGNKFGSSGFVAESVPLAVYAASCTETIGYGSVLNSVIVCGGDTDTTASIAGQIAGSKLGISRIPSELSELLPQKEMLMEMAWTFARTAESIKAL